MPFAEEDIPKLKPWLIKRSGELSDAEPDVLADYVIALLNNKVEGDELIKLLTEQLDDFLQDSNSFAFEIVNVLSTRAFEKESTELAGEQSPQSLAQQTQQDSYKPDPNPYRNAPPDYKSKQRRNNFQQAQQTFIDNNTNNRQQQKENLKSLISPTEVPYAKHLIVANLPTDKLDEQLIRAYFSKFGAIDNVLIDLTTRIAEIEFANPFSAKKAWTSPVPIFDNRFIKVFFRKKDADKIEPEKTEEPFDVDEFKKKQIEKQKEFEERLAKRKAQDAKLKEVISLKEKMLANYEKELASLEAEFKEHPEKEAEIKARVDGIQKHMTEHGVTPGEIAADKARLNGTIPIVPSRARGRGRGRGRGGAVRGRGGFNPYIRPSNASYNRTLDLRTKTVTVKNLSDSQNEEFKKVLESFGDNVASITNKDPSSLNITFRERFHAERFLNDKNDIRGIGALDKEWDESVRPSAVPTLPLSASENNDASNGSNGSDDVEMS